MRCKKMVSFDYDKLTLEIEKRGMNNAEAAEKIGKSYGYVYNLKRKGAIPYAVAKVIETVLGIPLDAYVKREQQAPVESAEKEDNDFSYNKIYEVVYAAVYHAVKQAFKDA